MYSRYNHYYEPKKSPWEKKLKISPFLFVAVVILCIALIIYNINYTCYYRKESCKFKEIDSKRQYYYLIDEFGQPDISKNEAKGFMTWYPKKNNKGFWDYITLKDECIKHGNHNDCIFAGVFLSFKPEQIQRIKSLNECITYDEKNKELSIRCKDMLSIRKLLEDILAQLGEKVNEKENKEKGKNDHLGHIIEKYMYETEVNPMAHYPISP